MKPTYILRLDDACPTFDRSQWFRIEKILDQLKLVPIVAVVPDNQDPTLKETKIGQNFGGGSRKSRTIMVG